MSKTCFMCLSNDQLQIQLFGEYASEKKLIHKISICLQIRVQNEKGTIKWICYVCIHKVEMFFEFKINVLSNQQDTVKIVESDKYASSKSKKKPVQEYQPPQSLKSNMNLIKPVIRSGEDLWNTSEESMDNVVVYKSKNVALKSNNTKIDSESILAEHFNEMLEEENIEKHDWQPKLLEKNKANQMKNIHKTSGQKSKPFGNWNARKNINMKSSKVKGKNIISKQENIISGEVLECQESPYVLSPDKKSNPFSFINKLKNKKVTVFENGHSDLHLEKVGTFETLGTQFRLKKENPPNVNFKYSNDMFGTQDDNNPYESENSSQDNSEIRLTPDVNIIQKLRQEVYKY